MAKKTVNIGQTANDRTGDSLRSAFNKINENFTELYTQLGINSDDDLNLGSFEFTGNTLTTTDSTAIVIDQAASITGDFTVGGDIVPNVTEEHNLGSVTRRFKDIYLSGSTIDLGGTTLSVVGGELQLSGIKIPTTTDLESNTGDITFTDTTISAPDDENITIQALDNNSVLRSRLRLDPGDGAVSMRGYSSEDSTTFDDNDWDTATWIASGGGGAVIIANAAAIRDFINDDLDNATGVTFSINGGTAESFSSIGYSGLTQTLTLGTSAAPDTDPTTVTQLEIFYRFSSSIGIDYDDGSVSMSARGNMSMSLDSDEDINLTAGDDVRITGADNLQLRNTSTTNHILIRTDYDNEDYVWEFRADGAMSFPDNSRQTTAYTGPQTTLDGDVTGSVFADDSTLLVDGVTGKIVGEIASRDWITEGSVDIVTGFLEIEPDFMQVNVKDGGYLQLNAGEGAEGTSGGGYIQINAGDGTDSRDGGYLQITSGSAENNSNPGDIRIYAGSSENQPGGDVRIRAGSSDNSTDGTIEIGVSNTSSVIIRNADIEGDLTGSVLGDDSFVIVDGTSGTLYGRLETDSVAIFGGTEGIDLAEVTDKAGAIINDKDIYITGGESIRFTQLNDYDGLSTSVLRFWNIGDTRWDGSSEDTELGGINVGNDAAEGEFVRGFVELRAESEADDNDQYYKFDSYGVMTIPGAIKSENQITITVDPGDSSAKQWYFGADGNLDFPDATTQTTAYVERFVNRSTFTSDFTINAGSATLLQFDAFQGSRAFDAATYQWTPANTGLYRLDFVLGLTESEADLPLIVFLYNVTDNENQIQLFNGSFSGSVLSMSGTTYLDAAKSYQFGIIQNIEGDAIVLDKDLTSAGIEELTRV